MANIALSAKKREKTTKSGLSTMRKQGRIPAVIYGLDKEPELVEVNAAEMRPHLSHRNHVIDLKVDATSQQVLIKAVERDPIRKDLVHIDFLRVNNERPVIVNVPVTTYGIPVGVKTQGGVFSTMKKFVKLRSKIHDIPEVFHIDVSEINQGTIVYVKDLKFEKGTFVTPGKTALFGVTAGKTAEEEAAAIAGPVSAVPAAATAPAAAAAAPEKEKGKEKK